MASRLRILPAVLALSASALLLTACVPSTPEPVGSNSASPSASATTDSTPSATATSSASASPSAKPSSSAPSAPATHAPEATAVSFDCGDLISPQTMYDFNPNYLLLNDFTPAAGSVAATAIAAKGVACRWENSTSGITIDVSAAKPASDKIDGLKSNAGSQSSQIDGYFAVSGGTGTAQIFSGNYWATLSSKAFVNASDASDLAAEVRSALK